MSISAEAVGGVRPTTRAMSWQGKARLSRVCGFESTWEQSVVVLLLYNLED